MKPRFIPLLSLLLLLPAAAGAQQLQAYNYAQIFSPNSTVDLIPSTSVSGILNGINCIFPSTSAAVAVKITMDGVTTTLTIDPTFFEREASGAGQYLSGWIPLEATFATGIHVQLNNTGLGTATINCWASWAH